MCQLRISNILSRRHPHKKKEEERWRRRAEESLVNLSKRLSIEIFLLFCHPPPPRHPPSASFNCRPMREALMHAQRNNIDAQFRVTQSLCHCAHNAEKLHKGLELWGSSFQLLIAGEQQMQRILNISWDFFTLFDVSSFPLQFSSPRGNEKDIS